MKTDFLQQLRYETFNTNFSHYVGVFIGNTPTKDIRSALNSYCGYGALIVMSDANMVINSVSHSNPYIIHAFENKFDLVKFRLMAGYDGPAYSKLSMLLELDRLIIGEQDKEIDLGSIKRRMFERIYQSMKVESWLVSMNNAGWITR